MAAKLPIDRVREAEDAPRIYTLERQRFAEKQARLREEARQYDSPHAPAGMPHTDRGASDGAPDDA